MKGALRLFFPPQCLGCAEPVAEEGALCAVCWQETQFINAHSCAQCSVPLPPADDAGRLQCDDCLATPRPWQDGRAVMVYHGMGRKLAMMLKHGDRLDLVPALGTWLARAGAPLVRPGMIVAPVPMHPHRLILRKFNQAAMLSRRVALAHGLEHAPDLLRRTRHTSSQGQRDHAARALNQQGSITLRTGARQAIAGKPVLLVDDVMASGATLAAAAEALVMAGAGPVSVLVLARAVKDT